MSESHAIDPSEARRRWTSLRSGEPTEPSDRRGCALGLALGLVRDAECRRAVNELIDRTGALRWADGDDLQALARAKLRRGLDLEQVLRSNGRLAEFVALHPNDAERLAREAEQQATRGERSDASRLPADGPDPGSSDAPPPPDREGPADASASRTGVPGAQTEREQGLTGVS